MGAWVSMAVAAAAAAFVGCGEKDEPEPAPAPTNLTTKIERAAQKTLEAGPSEIRITVARIPGTTEYTITETLDPDSGWYLANEPPRAPGKKLAVRWPPITGPAFEFGASDTGRAYIGGPRCWVEAHAPAGRARGAMSVEEALVTSHAILNLLTRNVAEATEAPVLLRDPLPPKPPETYEVVLGLPNESTSRRIIAGLEENRIGVGLDEGRLTTFVALVAGGKSPLTLTPKRPESAIIVKFTGIGEGEPVEEPKCLAIE